MIKKIAKLKNFGIFHDFSWKTELSEFKKFNLIYGWNRSGKTTISRAFEACEKSDLEFVNCPENCQIEIETDSTVEIGKKFNNENIHSCWLPIKVFNCDFIAENIYFDPSDSCNPIVYVSEKDIESKKRLEQIKLDKITLGKTYEQAKKDKSAKEETKNTFLTGLGREIANILFDKSYNKTKAESKINTIGVDNFVDKILSDEDKKKYEATSKSEAGKTQTVFSEYNFLFSFDDEIIVNFQKIFEKIGALLEKKVVSETLDRLKDDQILNNWVKQGFDLHKTKEEKEKCLFCQKPLDDDFLAMLSKHFSKDYEDLQSATTSLKSEILKIKQIEIVAKNDDLYPDLKDKYTSKAKELNKCIKKINTWIDEATKSLQEKYDNPLVVVSNPKQPEDFLSSYNDAILELNKIINEHNEKAKNHASEVSNAREKLELNSIATALVGQDYKKMGIDLEEALKNEKEALTAVNKNNSDISELEKQTSDTGKAIIDINKHLKEFFGRKEIELALDGDNKGYTIKRDEKPAKNLSEGEKTAIAFSYFVVKVGEGDFDKSKGIIFIDDPISSFDSNFIYHCFSMIKNHFNEVGQLFISTHNFQLFNLVKDWFVKKNENRKEDGKDENCGFYMIKPILNTKPRESKLTILDTTLKEHKSEYSFLFSLLRDFDNKAEEPSFEEIYNIANIGRRFFDIFVDFKIPSNKKEQKEKLDIIVDEINKKKTKEEDKISKVACDKVFWLINGFSHNSDPTSTIEHKDKSESKNAIKILLNIVKESDPKHFEILEKNLVS